MNSSLLKYTDPANYHTEAVTNADLKSIEKTEPNFLIIRLGIELHRNDFAAASAVLKRLEVEEQQGYELFQIVTAKLMVALHQGDKNTIRNSIEEWLAVRKTAPNNFADEVLAAPELQEYLKSIDPEKIVAPVIEPYVVTDEDRALLNDHDKAREIAVTENLEWLRPLGVIGSIKEITDTYRISYANHHLREITFCSTSDFPSLIVSVDEKGNFLGSFISH